jgi:hypothetical protein
VMFVCPKKKMGVIKKKVKISKKEEEDSSI